MAGNSEPESGRESTAIAVAFVAFFSTIVLVIFPPFWETNDDVGMAMFADGYGFAAYPSSTVIFSNVLYGYFLSALPQIGDISRYSLASMALNVVAVGVICRALILLTTGRLTALAVTALAGILPLTVPQFTVLAGMLTTAGLLQLNLYFRRQSLPELWTATILLFVGYLIRSQEFTLVLLLYLPFLPLRQSLTSWPLRLMVVGLGVLILVAVSADYAYYQQPEWTAFRELNLLRVPFTDFGLASYIQAHPELLEGTTYSLNDISLLGNWWLVDPFGSNWRGLAHILSRVSLPSFVEWNLDNAWRAVASLLQVPFFYILAPAVLAAVLARSLRATLAWLTFAGIVVAFGLLGRQPVTRVFYAPVVLLLCLTAMNIPRRSRQWVLIVGIVLGTVGILHNVAKRNAIYAYQHTGARNDIAGLDKSSVYVVWGSTLNLEALYPVFVSMKEVRPLRLYGLGVTSLAPFALAHWRDTPEYLPGRLVNGPPVSFFATKPLIDSLAVYCQERHTAKLRILNARQLSLGSLFIVTCRNDGD